MRENIGRRSGCGMEKRKACMLAYILSHVIRTVSCTRSHAFSFHWPVAFRELAAAHMAARARARAHTVQRQTHDAPAVCNCLPS